MYKYLLPLFLLSCTPDPPMSTSPKTPEVEYQVQSGYRSSFGIKAIVYDDLELATGYYYGCLTKPDRMPGHICRLLSFQWGEGRIEKVHEMTMELWIKLHPVKKEKECCCCCKCCDK